MGKQWEQWLTLFFCSQFSKITADGDCSHEIKRCLLLGRKVMTNLDGILKSRDITLPTKSKQSRLVMYRCELDHKEGWMPKNWCFQTVVLEKTPESPLDTKEIKAVNVKGNQPWILVRRLLKLKLQYFGHWCKQPTHWKSRWCWGRLRAEGEEGIRGWDGWISSPKQWTWTWAKFGRWWGTERPGVLQSLGSQRVRHDWTAEQQVSKFYTWETATQRG